jgi:hypothetical protein
MIVLNFLFLFYLRTWPLTYENDARLREWHVKSGATRFCKAVSDFTLLTEGEHRTPRTQPCFAPPLGSIVVEMMHQHSLSVNEQEIKHSDRAPMRKAEIL